MDEATEIALRTAAAEKLNESLAKRITRWKRTRLALLLASLSFAAGFLAYRPWALLAPPFFIAAFCFLMLYLAARDQLREVKARRWKSQTPFISRLNEARRLKLEAQQKLPAK